MDNTELTSLTTRIKGLEAIVAEIDTRLDSIDKLQAIVITMYAEMFAGIEALASIVAGSDEDTKEKLFARRDEATKAIWTLLGKSTNEVLADLDDETRVAMEEFVRGTSAPDS